MGKRLSVRYVGNIQSCCTAMIHVPEGTEFKAVKCDLITGTSIGVYVRGSSLTKAAKGKHKFTAKQYLFIIGDNPKHNAMEVIDGVG